MTKICKIALLKNVDSKLPKTLALVQNANTEKKSREKNIFEIHAASVFKNKNLVYDGICSIPLNMFY